MAATRGGAEDARGEPHTPLLYQTGQGKRRGKTMELDQLKSYLQDYVDSVTRKSKGGLYTCPICGSGTGAHKTGAFSVKNGEQWHCFACDQGGDIYDLYAALHNCDLSEATRAIMAQYGNNSKPLKGADKTSTKPVQNQTETTAAPPQDYAAELATYHAALAGSPGETYLQGRGFTVETMNRFNLGYNAAKKTITIPYNTAGTYYGQRSVDPNARPHDNLAGITMPLFNAAALYSASAVFIVESPLCAISIMQEGGQAVAISGTGGKGRLIEQLKKKPTKAALVLALDNDEPGEKAAEELAAELTALDVFYLQANIAGEYKDPNERLQHDKAGLQAAISEAAAEAVKAQDIEAQAEREEYQQESAASHIDAFIGAIDESINTPAIPTGFSGLDTLLEGGLYEGLYIIGAISSLGKTTFALQIADQVAAGGHDVIIFSLEMARYELMAKSISRLTYKLTLERELSSRNAKTTRGITTGKRYADYSDAEIQLIEAASGRYREKISGRVWIKEGMGDIGAADIREAAEKHIRITGHKPVILLDYLQIIAPNEIRATDKQNTDKAVLELKRLSRDYKIPVIGISSFNRENYTAPVNMAAFKESGAIEYSSDVLIGLQYTGMDYEEGEADKAREKRIRKLFKENDQAAKEGGGVAIDLKILKNRNGGRGIAMLTFYPMFNYFTEYEAKEKPAIPRF